MALVSGKEILNKANKEGYAVGAFNINNMEILQGIIKGCREKKSPVIIAVSEGAIKYAGFDYIVAMVNVAAKENIPIALHLDHGRDMDIIKKCIEGGFTSIMIDASNLPFEENIEKTKKVVEMAKPFNIAVEAELGRLVGIEDNISVKERDAVLINPDEAKEFVKKTGIDSLAPAIGTSHGAFKFKGKPKLDFDRLKEVKEKTKIPLVLHGASSVIPYILEMVNSYGGDLKEAKGVPEEDIKKAISFGINKVNVDTDLRLSLVAAIRKVLAENKKEFDPRKILGPARDLISEVVAHKVELFGSSDKA
ncbi:MAG: class II fructose-1,6-bisphosphate aldolase [Spirochaetes bacterium]|nr:class II fructose-1,6-bisphosphate aldolase [Deltaproteobacteria bacterium]RKY02032.1 MAG: class II fructose-1,6-bisphosphate aldolase [Spirochaetota bacterium]RLA88810.1 MAG: class II fructose-1,6-bisphosphate aldolase [Deltaproteobacteria bacterium]